MASMRIGYPKSRFRSFESATRASIKTLSVTRT